MKYLLLIYEAESVAAARSEAESKQFGADYVSFTKELRASGKMLGGDPLESIDTATTVRVRDGETLLSDGPFAETKEQLGGFYLIEADDLDEALAIAARIPSAKTGSIEVRPIMPFDY